MARVLISGGTGLIGKALSDLLLKNGHTVTHIGRTENLTGRIKCYQWNINNKTIDERAFEGVDTIIHLAGAGIADKRWTKKQKQEILESRIRSADLLIKYANQSISNVKCFIGGSAVGFYGGITENKIFDENDEAGSDFLANTCKEWEKHYELLNVNIRKVIIRTGVVFSTNGGALSKIINPIKFGLGSGVGSGNQIVPWIHVKDIVKLFNEAITNSNMEGVFNGVAPEIITNYELTKKIAGIYNKPIILPNVPKFLLRLILGEMAVLVTEGSAISAKKTQSIPFKFEFPDLDSALRDLLLNKNDNQI